MYKTLLFLCFVTLLFSCSKEVELPQEEKVQLVQIESDIAEDEFLKKGIPLPKQCCKNTNLTSTFLSTNGICCSYYFEYTKNNISTGVDFCRIELSEGAVWNNEIQENSSTIRWISQVCVDDNGNCDSKDIEVYSIGKNGYKFVCQSETISTDCPCPYTFSEGRQTGSSIANQTDCNTSSPQYLNTIRDFNCMCPEYVAGFLQGWEQFCVQEECGGPPPDKTCECIDGSWECP